MGFSVAHDVQINKFFELQWAGFHVFDDVHEEHGYVLASGHRVDDSSDGLLFSGGVDIVEFSPQLSDLTSFLCHWDLIFKIKDPEYEFYNYSIWFGITY